MRSFDPYDEWLQIPPSRQPPNDFDLLGIDRSSGDVTEDRISRAYAIRQKYVAKFRHTIHRAHCERILGEIDAARDRLREQLSRPTAIVGSQAPTPAENAPRSFEEEIESVLASASPSFAKEMPAAVAEIPALDAVGTTNERLSSFEVVTGAAPARALASSKIAETAAPATSNVSGTLATKSWREGARIWMASIASLAAVVVLLLIGIHWLPGDVIPSDDRGGALAAAADLSRQIPLRDVESVSANEGTMGPAPSTVTPALPTMTGEPARATMKPATPEEPARGVTNDTKAAPAKDATSSDSAMEGKAAGESREFAGMHFHWCPSGNFVMGSPKTEFGRSLNEQQLPTFIHSGYWMARYELTRHDWGRVMGVSVDDPSLTPQHPAAGMSWRQANQFCLKLSAIERRSGRLPAGWRFSLPTQAEWEYACRAGSNSPFSFGYAATILDANFNGRFPYLSIIEGAGHGAAAAVGRYKHNPWGLHDMHGNLAEMCSDTVGRTENNGQNDSVAYVLRGGCFMDPAMSCRSAARGVLQANMAVATVGFRLVLGRSDGATPAIDSADEPLAAVEEVPKAEVPEADDSAAMTPAAKQSGEDDQANAPAKAEFVEIVDGVKPGDEITVGGIVFCWCPPGTFMMGSPATEILRQKNEAPTKIEFRRGFWIGKYEVTWREWIGIMGKDGGGSGLASEHPVTKVSLEKVLNFLIAMQRKYQLSGSHQVSIPTEAMWEYACRAGTTTATAFGDSLTSKQANMNGSRPYPYINQGGGRFLREPTAVGSYAGNQWGIHDMHGNVREWCLDKVDYWSRVRGERDVGNAAEGPWPGDVVALLEVVKTTWAPAPPQSRNPRMQNRPIPQKQNSKDIDEDGEEVFGGRRPADLPAAPPLVPAHSTRETAIRGGGFRSEGRECRSANRSYTTAGYGSDDLGFRLVIFNSQP